MKHHYLKLFVISIFAVMLLGACGADEEAHGENENGEENATEQDKAEMESEGQQDDESASEEEEADTSGAVAPQSSEDEVSFEQVSWIMGSPDRRAEAGIWFYTEDEHPEDYDSSFDWEEEDILLWQISDEKYAGHSPDTEQLVKMDDDVIKIVVVFDEDEEPSDEKMPRNYLKAPKGELEGKNYMIETIDGEELSLE
ncbi:hypothetical protein J2Z83_000605 [Virgibacillus natechei]|uniref:Lipoprotein n=1 Tax=Virgibacillus natechei TaxID=1216297 RepID=A0ABS4ICD5_9BACI|nr:hypothetical protein [Virgibacillus natechei]MBP1968513.1 hypothetical protein [Virgibacillus natechei]UZD13628.1 hypothetical protein OLD84_03465 [Virgibacillus natechei]